MAREVCSVPNRLFSSMYQIAGRETPLKKGSKHSKQTDTSIKTHEDYYDKDVVAEYPKYIKKALRPKWVLISDCLQSSPICFSRSTSLGQQ